MACSPASLVYNLGFQWALTSFKLGWELVLSSLSFLVFSQWLPLPPHDCHQSVSDGWFELFNDLPLHWHGSCV